MAGPEAVSNRDLDGLQKAPPNSICLLYTSDAADEP